MLLSPIWMTVFFGIDLGSSWIATALDRIAPESSHNRLNPVLGSLSILSGHSLLRHNLGQKGCPGEAASLGTRGRGSKDFGNFDMVRLCGKVRLFLAYTVSVRGRIFG